MRGANVEKKEEKKKERKKKTAFFCLKPLNLAVIVKELHIGAWIPGRTPFCFAVKDFASLIRPWCCS